MKVRLIGNGGHASNLKPGLKIDPESPNKVLAFGGLTCEKLEKRVNERPDGFYPNIVSSDAFYELWDAKAQGVHILAGALIQANVTLGDFCIINTGAIIEHNCTIGKGTHLAPGAIVLGDCKIGDFCFIGANATVIQGSVVPDRTFIKAGSVWNKQ